MTSLLDLAGELKIVLLMLYIFFLPFLNKGSGLVQSQPEHCLQRWAEGAARAAGTYLPGLHLSEPALLCESLSRWID